MYDRLSESVPANKLGWRAMSGTRSFHDVFAHVAAEEDGLHEHLGQLVSYARMNQIVPPWSRKTG